jgi:hypothetical protein
MVVGNRALCDFAHSDAERSVAVSFLVNRVLRGLTRLCFGVRRIVTQARHDGASRRMAWSLPANPKAF